MQTEVILAISAFLITLIELAVLIGLTLRLVNTPEKEKKRVKSDLQKIKDQINEE